MFDHRLVDGRDLGELRLVFGIYGEDHMIVAVADMAENGSRNTAVLQQGAGPEDAATEFRYRNADI
ncbi:hypothetical protein GGD56_000762 [Rhizobium mongolense]|uniref:Uncharacterized protein n=1 Tax=Rhizobium mongolense TaxID=57676 RepID=A0ABR6IGE8_9HYPH|nr:hypothetical protein [Rhizobium mongolense]